MTKFEIDTYNVRENYNEIFELFEDWIYSPERDSRDLMQLIEDKCNFKFQTINMQTFRNVLKAVYPDYRKMIKIRCSQCAIAHSSKLAKNKSVQKSKSDKMKLNMRTTDLKNRISSSVNATYSTGEPQKKISNKIQKLILNEDWRASMLGVNNPKRKYDTQRKLRLSRSLKKMDLSKIVEKRKATLRKNKTFNKSKQEDEMYESLCFKFGKHDVIRQYQSKEYPFACDFYILSLDLYIEFNGSQYHGKHKFDPLNIDDLTTLWRLKSKVKFYKTSKGKWKLNQYQAMIDTWTLKDIEKFNCAKKNDLNYIAFYSLHEFNEWL